MYLLTDTHLVANFISFFFLFPKVRKCYLTQLAHGNRYFFYRLSSDQDGKSFPSSISSSFIRYIKKDCALGQILSVVKRFFLQGMNGGGQKVMIQQLFIHTSQFRGSLRLFQFLLKLRRALYLTRDPADCSQVH